MWYNLLARFAMGQYANFAYINARLSLNGAEYQAYDINTHEQSLPCIFFFIIYKQSHYFLKNYRKIIIFVL